MLKIKLFLSEEYFSKLEINPQFEFSYNIYNI